MHRPRQQKVPFDRLLREAPKLMRLGQGRFTDLLRALAELALARWMLSRRTIRELGIPDLVRSATAAAPALTAQQREIVMRVSKAIAIVAPRVPWRSDCLVQCLAGRRWLAARGIASQIRIGIKKDVEGGRHEVLLAHAWLAADDAIVTGGDLGGFEVFAGSSKN